MLEMAKTMTKPKSELVEVYRGYEIRYRPWLKRRPWRCQYPHPDDPKRMLWADVVSQERARWIIDRGIYLHRGGSLNER